MFLLHLRDNPEDDNCTDYSADKFSNPSIGLNAKEAEQPAAKHAADDAKEEVDEQSFPVTALQLACDEAGQYAGYDSNDKSLHCVEGLG